MPPVMLQEAVENMLNDAVGQPVGTPNTISTIQEDIREIKFSIDFGSNETGCFFDSSQIRATVNPDNFLAQSETSCIVSRGKTDPVQKVRLKICKNLNFITLSKSNSKLKLEIQTRNRN